MFQSVLECGSPHLVKGTSFPHQTKYHYKTLYIMHMHSKNSILARMSPLPIYIKRRQLFLYSVSRFDVNSVVYKRDAIVICLYLEKEGWMSTAVILL